jgi:ribonuclease P protein component
VSLKGKKEIAELLGCGRRYAGKSFTAVYLPAADFRCAVLLSRRHGPAVVRNRLKRLFREAIRSERQKHLKTGRLAVLPGQVEEKIKYETIRADVSRVLENISGSQKSI